MDRQICVSIVPMTQADAEWYCREDPEGDRFYEIFSQMCWKCGVRWASADEKERRFIEEVTTAPAKAYDRQKAPYVGE